MPPPVNCQSGSVPWWARLPETVGEVGMNAKHVNRNSIRLAQAATGISPADFPIGSLESRAAARALLEQADRWKPKLSEYDTDALTMYRHCDLLRGLPVSPGILEIEGTALY